MTPLSPLPRFSQSPLCSSWAIPCGAGRGRVPTRLNYLPNHQPALGWLLSLFLSPPSAPWRGILLLTGSKMPPLFGRQ